MTITLSHLRRGNRRRSNTSRCTGWASSLGALLIGSSLAFAPACSGSDSSDDANAEDTADEAAPSGAPSAPGANEREPTTPGGNDEGGPNVTDIDESTRPGNPSSGGDGPEGDPDQEAAGMSALPGSGVEVPDSDLCAAVADWDPEWVQYEEEVLLLVNEFRSQPADCGLAGLFETAPPLAMDPILRCSARLHSLDMFERDFFDHNAPGGVTPAERMAAAGFEGRLLGENIAQGQRTPEEVMVAWMESDGHCENIMRTEYTLIGIGYSPGAPVRQGRSDFWTQNFGTPLSARTRR